ncbi:hypothetical protein EVAR_75374_1 [Eumeta japonica]|uniref:Uncharacterized protein n=1 Tax=Eumeta variegata TaxID=151549 RepID=A0A4C1YEJ7_EUMVA|nr:hypothetical protein EVAR_75374_1 [Eumeta japonica]
MPILLYFFQNGIDFMQLAAFACCELCPLLDPFGPAVQGALKVVTHTGRLPLRSGQDITRDKDGVWSPLATLAPAGGRARELPSNLTHRNFHGLSSTQGNISLEIITQAGDMKTVKYLRELLSLKFFNQRNVQLFLCTTRHCLDACGHTLGHAGPRLASVEKHFTSSTENHSIGANQLLIDIKLSARSWSVRNLGSGAVLYASISQHPFS